MMTERPISNGKTSLITTSTRIQQINANRNGGPKYEKVLYTKDGKTYEFKTVRALAKFLGKSETQTHRMLRQNPNIQTIEKS